MKITELNKILIAADEFDPDFGCLLRVIVATGARRGELCALRWTDIDLAAGTILIARSITTVGKAEKSTKSHAERRLSIDAGTVAVLGEHLDRVVDRCTAAGISFPVHGFVFSFHLDGSVPYHPDSVTQRFSRLRERVGLERGMRLHDLRHAHASLLLDAGVPLATVSERLGHANPHTTLVIYTHGVSEGDRRASATFGDLLDDGDDDSTGEDPDTIEPG